MAQRSVPAPFLKKTFQLVDDRSTDDVVSWNDSGTAFVVWKMAEFAKDLLPNYFKHSNFSSFVRQLNTYGFRKIVPDKWEFANDNFKRGQEELLLQIRRRKAVNAIPSQSPVPMAAGGSSSPSNSGEDLGSTSSSSHGNNAKSVADENAKLKRDNELLSSELAEMKKKCGDLVVFLSQYVKAGPDQIDRIMRQGRCGSIVDGFDSDASDECYEDDGDENLGGKGTGTGTGDGLKLFGVWVKEEKRKRRRKEMKAVDYEAPIPWPWMKKISASAGGEPSKVCHRPISCGIKERGVA
ncbi:heat shock factor protein HSF24-like [Diospyros lotus]|uniref:heat shock factor protein HSF24-like n=1 Tax=Diospyros lotus TaxID=55363 RepID=UPI0022533E6A|nr:heat shock factor protein HSF24-like [Diospyros lotus]